MILRHDDGSLLRNIMCSIYADTHTTGLTDDVAVEIVANNLKKITQIADQAVAMIRRWLSSGVLQIAGHKIEAVLVEDCRDHFNNCWRP